MSWWECILVGIAASVFAKFLGISWPWALIICGVAGFLTGLIVTAIRYVQSPKGATHDHSG
jgi:hypothetical protein